MIDHPQTGPHQTNGRHELAEFLRARRARLQPAMFGLEAGTRRRTPGLRREEMAQLAGVSATWYTWIEQGRDVSVSASALARLCRIIGLTSAERAYVFDLGGKRDPHLGQTPGTGEIPVGLTAAVKAIAAPAYVIDKTWTALCWNAAAMHLFTGWLGKESGPEGERNLLRFIFLNPHARTLIHDWDVRARRVAAEFRADYSHHLEAADLQALIAELSAKSPFFAESWHAHAVIEREGGTRTFNHPTDGFLRYEQLSFSLARHPDVKLVMLVDP